MKKQILSAVLAFAVTGAFAQDLVSKKGENYLPEAGDWAIGVDATPFLNYFGNFFSQAGNNAPGFNFVNQQAIVGKYFKDANTAYRVAIRLNNTSSTTRSFVNDDANTTVPTFPAINEPLEDVSKTSSSNVVIGLGYEKRRGNTRLQGFYGGDFLLIFGGGSRNTYEYANELTTTNTTPSRTTFESSQSPYGGWVTESRTGNLFGIGVRGFIGAEYFIIPKLSIAGEFGWSIITTSTGQSSQVSEALNAGNTAVGETEIVTSTKSSGLRIDTDNFPTASGSLRITFHF